MQAEYIQQTIWIPIQWVSKYSDVVMLAAKRLIHSKGFTEITFLQIGDSKYYIVRANIEEMQWVGK